MKLLTQKLKEACEKLDGLFEDNQCMLNVSGGRIYVKLDGHKAIITRERQTKSVYGLERSSIEINKISDIKLSSEYKIPSIELEFDNGVVFITRKESYYYGLHSKGNVFAALKTGRNNFVSVKL